MKDTIWSALVDARRRAVLDLLRERDRTVGELVDRLGTTQPTVSKHLRVLREAGLVHVRVDAQRRVYGLEPGPIAELDIWLAPYRRLWNARLDALDRHLDARVAEDEETHEATGRDE
ncbi:ArsR family transcriptional regulator [Streptomyces armeniacus]|uniref:ArsR family transcriptional regulator n=1 Tax=Streptomyces armeniacus TaxID=83291 RepID=A0A345XT46_9ACTN|nr:metalloregulator ArsR/SmtB family transcription factor [Streptomyces armeniacus]AXK34812.1 ArsR family transcriptional regulator [Streptomyces armeniacus]